MKVHILKEATMTKLSDLSIFQDVPDTFIIFEKDGVVGWVCKRCEDTGTWKKDSIEFLVNFANQLHTTCEIKADLEEVSHGV